MNRHMYILADGGRTPEHFMDDLKKYGYIKG